MKKNAPSSKKEHAQDPRLQASSVPVSAIVSDSMEFSIPEELATPLNDKIKTSIIIAEDGYNSQENDYVDIDSVMAMKYPVVGNDVFGAELDDGAVYSSLFKKRLNALKALEFMKKKESDTELFCARINDEAKTYICASSPEKLQKMVDHVEKKRKGL